mgnify:CR=1 FL=1
MLNIKKLFSIHEDNKYYSILKLISNIKYINETNIIKLPNLYKQLIVVISYFLIVPIICGGLLYGYNTLSKSIGFPKNDLFFYGVLYVDILWLYISLRILKVEIDCKITSPLRIYMMLHPEEYQHFQTYHTGKEALHEVKTLNKIITKKDSPKKRKTRL